MSDTLYILVTLCILFLRIYALLDVSSGCLKPIRSISHHQILLLRIYALLDVSSGCLKPIRSKSVVDPKYISFLTFTSTLVKLILIYDCLIWKQSDVWKKWNWMWKMDELNFREDVGKYCQHKSIRYTILSFRHTFCVSRHKNNSNLIVYLHQNSWVTRYIVNKNQYFEFFFFFLSSRPHGKLKIFSNLKPCYKPCCVLFPIYRA